MKGSKWAVLMLLAAAIVGTAACDDAQPVTPTPPTPVQVTETFTGPLALNGSTTHTFNSNGSGIVAATLTTLEPETDPPTQISIALGTYNGTNCTLIVTNDQAVKTSIVNGTATGATGLCLRVSDAKGNLTQTVTYAVTVAHF